ncbi:hypothetical protein [Plantactinospora sp. WMMB782]|uniref:hypothetical protein n=1 Tax=Plantactinospora sp. WMMB782 TaxID=3404121 RepID=UPI003B94143B
MDQGRHRAISKARLLPQINSATYPVGVAAGDDIRRLRVEQSLWDAYTEIVGDGGRSADLKAYIEWRVDNPTTPLPGKRRGPVKKERRRSSDKPAESATSAD